MTLKHRLTQFGYLLLAGVALSLPACGIDGHFTLLGYTSRPVHDPNIRTVRVPIFQNETFRKGLEFQLTEAVIREIEARTPWKVVPAGYPADTELIGTIADRQKNLVLMNQLGEVRDAETTMSIEVVWNDLRFGQMGPALPAAMPDQPLPPVFDPPPQPPKVLVQSMWSFRPELGESLSTAEKIMIDRMAVRIVNMMELPW